MEGKNVSPAVAVIVILIVIVIVLAIGWATMLNKAPDVDEEGDIGVAPELPGEVPELAEPPVEEATDEDDGPMDGADVEAAAAAAAAASSGEESDEPVETEGETTE
ncbi:MAG TPA: hypothetical protein QGH10_12810 [Armatimonadota bacterium]|nr:hypothetical protein [Armatimonadota bacterium]